jgi:hypothetical protein
MPVVPEFANHFNRKSTKNIKCVDLALPLDFGLIPGTFDNTEDTGLDFVCRALKFW